MPTDGARAAALRPSRAESAAPGLLGLAALLALLCGGAPAWALIEGSPHDLISQGYDVVKESLLQERCSRCHISTSPAFADFLPRVPAVLAPVYGAASLGCFSCHDGTTIVSPNVDASRTAYHPASHGNDLAGYEGLRHDEVGLPYLAGRRMECVTCHDPHDNAHRPFLRVGLDELCLVCHSRYTEFGRGNENRTGNHIVGVDPVAAPRVEVPLNLVPAFRTPFPSPYPLQTGREVGGWHWDLGGHLTEGGSGAIGCPTCHAVHGDETAAPAEQLMTIDPVNETSNLFCEGCHAGARDDGRPSPPRPNPGGTTTGRTYHAVDDDEANGHGRSLAIREPPGWPFGGGDPKRLLCTTCHTAHAAWVATPLLRTPPKSPGFCEECHELLPEWHHPVGDVAATRCGSTLPPGPYEGAQGLTCARCHEAHNAGIGRTPESDFVPLLIEPSGSGELCERCHPTGNPTCAENLEGMASHFIGDPTLPETYEDKNPPLRTDPWPESKLASEYWGAKKQVVTCMSCHSFAETAVVSGDAGTAPHLLARSGNGVEWGDDEGVYLCTGCHQANPATMSVAKGHTHPLLNARIEALGQPPVAPASATVEGHMNCDSCHRPHEARTASGYYILEAVSGIGKDPLTVHPEIDYTPLCHLCHEPGRY